MRLAYICATVACVAVPPSLWTAYRHAHPDFGCAMVDCHPAIHPDEWLPGGDMWKLIRGIPIGPGQDLAPAPYGSILPPLGYGNAGPWGSAPLVPNIDIVPSTFVVVPLANSPLPGTDTFPGLTPPGGPPNEMPEPTSWLLLAMGFAGFYWAFKLGHK